jgi:MATE family multidrug resistance protein
MAAFGALRGLQDMRTPLWIALAINSLNIVLDALLIFGAGPIPRLELAGAAWASTISQWLGASWALAAVARRLGWPGGLRWRDAGRLLVVGRDLFFRTGLLMVFMVLATRAANRLGTEAGAAHQVVRQIWAFTAFGLDAFAAAAQSLVSYFLASARVDLARRVAAVTCAWSFGAGIALTLLMGLATPAVVAALVPPEARSLFLGAWWIAALSQPINALSFATDGIHWGAADYRYLRNGMLAATAFGAAGLAWLEASGAASLTAVWTVTALWIGVRAVAGWLRVFPGLGRAPLAG